MIAYRKAIKEHFEAIDGFKKILAIDFVFWAFGLALYVIGLLVSGAVGSFLSNIGYWALLFGIALAFIKKNDWGLLISLGGLVIFSVVAFIVMAASLGAVEVGLLVNALGFLTLFILAYRAADFVKKSELKRAQEAAFLAQQVGERGVLCPHCHSVIAKEDKFCPGCGKPKPQGIVCAVCGAELAEGAVFCSKCGAGVSREKRCAACGATVGADSMFCPSCGNRFEE